MAVSGFDAGSSGTRNAAGWFGWRDARLNCAGKGNAGTLTAFGLTAGKRAISRTARATTRDCPNRFRRT